MMLPSKIYQKRLESGALAPDAAEAAALPYLDALCSGLSKPISKAGFFQRLFGMTSNKMRGLYMYGPVGRGKSFLMDLLFACVPTHVPKKRQHFHQFMRDVHHRLDTARRQGVANPLALLAVAIANEARLLCFDEMAVKDVADAMILSRLFEDLFRLGVVVVATSNIAPDNLYAGGLQRVRFLPFIAAIKRHCHVLEVAGAVDHRQQRLQGTQAYHFPLGAAASAALRDVFTRLTGGAHIAPQVLQVDGRELVLKQVSGDVLLTTFDEICRAPLGPADMLEIAACFNCVIMDGVPQLTADMRNETTRLIVLIDALYDARRQFFMAGAVALDQLCTPDNALAFDFQRTASRITEMQAADYQQTAAF
ncbi:MAG: cell division protein ZapE [Bdellovibrionales bacterium]